MKQSFFSMKMQAANIQALLLIHKETGIVLAHSEKPNSHHK
ncbi:MAG: hypothetical protein Q9M40_01400 [Sulfurimonas sp.]|nr:hypothetical protein [Sulfurimonas sp.]